MAQIVEVNGEEVEFPDDMTDAQIASVIRANIPKNTEAQAPQRGLLDRVYGGATSVANLLNNTAFFGFNDEIEGGVKAVYNPDDVGGDYGDRYTHYRDKSRANIEQSDKWAGKASMPIQLAGGILGPGLAGMKAINALQLPKAGATSLVSGLEGLLAGTGFSEAQTPAGVASDAAMAGGVSMLAGPTLSWGLGKLGGGLSEGGRAIWNKISASPKTVAMGRVRQALKDDAISFEDAQKMLQELGGEATLADLGPNVRNLGQVAATKPGQGVKIATDALEGRQQGLYGRLVDSAKKNMGAKWDSFHGFIRDNAAARKGQAEPLYKSAYEKNIKPTDEMLKIAKAPLFQKAAREAQGKLSNDIELMGGGLPAVSDGGVSTRLMHKIMKRLANDRDKAYRSGATDDYQDAKGIYNALRKEVYQQNPDFAKAQNVYAGSKQLEDAAETGRQMFRGQKWAEDLDETIGKYTDGEMDALRVGALRGIVEKVAAADESHNAVKKIGSSPRVKELLSRVFPDEASYESFVKTLASESKMAETRGSTLYGSKTSHVLNYDGASSQAQALGETGMNVAAGNWYTPVINGMRNLFGNKLTSEDYEEVAKIIFKKYPDIDNLFTKSMRDVVDTSSSTAAGLGTNAAGIYQYEQLKEPSHVKRQQTAH